MKLTELLIYPEITIQCHDNPDPDALACGFALYTYFQEKGKKVRLVYSGRQRIRKSNLLLMIDRLQIPVQYMEPDAGKQNGLLITVDCCYGEGNVTKLIADRIAVIDHHPNETKEKLAEINPMLGSCSTLVWKMLLEAGFVLSERKDVNTALYYGLLTDTGNFAELHHPLDRDMMDSLNYEKSLISLFCNSNISIEDMVIAGKAMINYRYYPEKRCCLIEAEACDPNLLGLISDLALQVDKFEVCIVYNEQSDGYKLSVRSCVREIRANELAAFLTEAVGNGGGHADKAGGFIFRKRLEETAPGSSMSEYFDRKINLYYGLCRVIDVRSYVPELTGMEEYEKNILKLGYVNPTDFLPTGSKVLVRTLEGDIELTLDGSFYIMVGLAGEVYPIRISEFEKSYERSDEPYSPVLEYMPTIRSYADGFVYDLSKYAKTCISLGKNHILARPVTEILKIFTLWDSEKYYLGMPGDYLACRKENPQDIYIVNKDIFHKTYHKL